MLMAEAERRADEVLYARCAVLFRQHVEAAWDPVCGGVFRGLRLRTHAYLLDDDAKVKWAHDEVVVGCVMLLAHAPQLPQANGEERDGEVLDGKTQTPRPGRSDHEPISSLREKVRSVVI